MPRPYQPPLSRRPQAVESAEPASPPRSRWLWVAVPLLVLGPVVAVVLATESAFNRPAPESPVAQPTLAAGPPLIAAQPTPTVIVSNPAGPGQPGGAPVATPTSAPSPGTAPAAAPTTAGTTSSTGSGSASPAAPTAEAGATGPYRAYRVQPGDTVRFVSEMFGVSTSSVIQASGLTDPNLLRVGQVLTVPIEPGYLYRVQPGETLDHIATRTGRSSDAIAAASRLSVASITAGDVILIPEQSSARAK